MATATARVRKKNSEGNPSGEKKPQANLIALSAAVWESIRKIAEKECRRDEVPDGAAHQIELSIAARIDGEHIYQRNLAGSVNVGHAITKASSTLPSVGLLLAHILAQLAPAHRESLARNLPNLAADNGGELPEIADSAIVELSENMLGSLRQQKQVKARGSVSAKFSDAQPSLKITG